MREKDIEKILVSAVKEVGGRAFKFVSPGNDGVPDRIVCLPGGDISFVELKTDKGRLTRLQAVQIDRLRDLGQSVCVVYGMGGLAEFLDLKGLHEQAERLRRRRDFADDPIRKETEP